MEKRHLLEVAQQQEALAAFNDLDRMMEIVDWDRFTPILEEAFGPPRTSGRGRRSWDYLVIFRCLLLGVMNGLSDARPALPAFGPHYVQAVCRSSER